MNVPVLSICIPTYNRAIYLKECLFSIIEASEGYLNKVEVIISDNASTDNTQEIALESIMNNPFIKYFRNNQNIGGERNFYKVATLATGDYIWVFGDDDKMTAEAISEVINRINLGYDLIIVNYSVWSKDLSLMKKARGLSIKLDTEFSEYNQLLKKFGIRLGYISSIIMKKQTFFRLPFSEYEKYIEYGLSFLFLVYSGICSQCFAIYVSKPLICNRSNNSGNYDWYKYFVEGSSKIFDILLLKNYSKEAVKSAKFKVLKDLVLRDILVRKRDGILTIEIIEILFRYYKRSWLFWFAAIPIFLLPSFPIKVANYVKKQIRRAKR